ncbi:sigma-54 dependent transcriptional regulator [Kiloniella laminariae]|uniref:Sigma-54 dependent transcriptional regulator n=1 Tax=Kiloniella laminariae TaxID=454162 RepID=A0ABT4LI58_9PROT|nr:sigma-54 dependent transcriptional regulator [Kiloniella laminariae]MCZ4280781.1 sigma-54 dependent transcriptional regulator [Kiloniella laminariae]
MTTSPEILLVEDTASLSAVYSRYLIRSGYQSTQVDSGAAALEELGNGGYLVMLLDLQLPDMDGLDILRYVQEKALPIAVVVITSNASVNVAVESMRLGAYDFLVKPFSADRLIVTVRNALKHMQLSAMVEAIKERSHYQGFIGSSLAMQSIYRTIDAAASSKATVFITGESGTGKEVCAEAIHKSSPRVDKPFVPLNCGAIPRDLMESEIFGHIKGAFTGAISNRDGAATQADGGTLFLDEICEMDLDLQTKLLRFIQSGTFQKVGSTRLEKVNIRIVCATNRNPLQEVQAGNFREDLYYRLHVIPIHLPPLRDRDQDVIEIAKAFLQEYAREEAKDFTTFSSEALQAIYEYSWPGNIRQLQNVIRNSVVLNSGTVLVASMLPPVLSAKKSGGGAIIPEQAPKDWRGGSRGGAGHVTEASASPQFPEKEGSEKIVPLWIVEKQAIEDAISLCGGSVTKAAAFLDINPSTIYRKKLQWDAD